MKEIVIKCKQCTKKYDLKKVVAMTTGPVLHCPHCKGKVGTI